MTEVDGPDEGVDIADTRRFRFDGSFDQVSSKNLAKREVDSPEVREIFISQEVSDAVNDFIR